MKQYINESLTDFPVFSDNAGFFRSIKKILIDGFGHYVPDLVDGQIVVFNNGLNTHEHTIYLVSDGIKNIRTKLNKVNDNTFEIMKDVSELNSNDIFIKTCPVGEWEEAENEIGEVGLKNNFSTVFFSKDFKSWRIRDVDGQYTDYQTFGNNAATSRYFSLIADSDSFFIKTWMNNSRLYNFFFLNNEIISVINDFYYSDYMRFNSIKISGLISRRKKAVSFTSGLMSNESYSISSQISDVSLISSALVNYAVLPMLCFSPVNIPQIKNNVYDDFFYAGGILFCAVKAYTGNYASIIKIGGADDY